MRAYLMRELPLPHSWRSLLRSAARLLMAAATLGMTSACGSGDDKIDLAPQYQAAVRQVMESYRAPGVVAGVWMPGQLPWVQAFGVRDLATGIPLSPEDHFPIASVTKSFTVNLILQLADQGQLSLDDTIDAYVAGIPNGGQITLLQLASMESGIKNYTAVPAFLSQFTQDMSASFSEQELVDFAMPDSPVFAPGAAYDYSNTNTVLLGMVVRQVTGLSMTDALHQYVFTPLRLTQSSYPTQMGLPAPYPQPYDVNQTTGTITPMPFINPSALAGAGALVSTISDMGTWGQALGSGRLLNPATYQLQLTHARAASNGPSYDTYGVGIGMLRGWLGHTGSSVGFQAACFFDPASGATIVALVNATPSGSANREDNIAEAVFIALADVIAAGR